MASLLSSLREFLKKNVEPNPKLLLGLSGGIDSLALFYLLLELRKHYPLELHAIYIDHGWRKESKEEAKQLAKLCKGQKVPFYTVKLKKPKNGNLEDIARQGRFQAFKVFQEKVKAEAVVLAHQKEDQGETILKRVFEGAGLLKLQGLKPIQYINGMKVIRPLLDTSKEVLKQYLEEKGYSWFEDMTNKDPKFLRSRLRLHFFPEVEKIFGKSMATNLCTLGNTISLLEGFFEHRFIELRRTLYEAEYGLLWDIRGKSLHLFEIKLFLETIAKEKGFFFSREIIQNAAQALLEVKEKKFHTGTSSIYIDQGMALLCRERPLFTGETTQSKVLLGKYTYEFKKQKVSAPIGIKGWGRFFYAPGEGKVSYIDYTQAKQDGALAARLAKLKIPLFLREIFPYIRDSKGHVYDFFSDNEKTRQICLFIKTNV